MDASMHRLCADDDTIARFSELVPTSFKFMQNAQPGSEVEGISEEQRREGARDSALVIIHWIGQLYTSCFYPQSRIVALEMLQKISVYLPFETRLGHVLPYIAKIFDQGGHQDE